MIKIEEIKKEDIFILTKDIPNFGSIGDTIFVDKIYKNTIKFYNFPLNQYLICSCQYFDFLERKKDEKSPS